MCSVRDAVIESARLKIGRPYLWGGQTDAGYDCSGFVVDCLLSAGVYLSDMNASGLAKEFHHYHKFVGAAEPGDLLFYGEDGQDPDHVMMVLDVWQNTDDGWPMMWLVGARGGDSSTKTMEEAYDRQAFVDVVRGDYWKRRFQFILGIE